MPPQIGDAQSSLCIACFSSLPPSRKGNPDIFHTLCCARPICPKCISSNPRLARYNPCLSCLGGVGLIQARSEATNLRPSTNASGVLKQTGASDLNIDGGIRDRDVYVLGDDDDSDDESEEGDGDGTKFSPSSSHVEIPNSLVADRESGAESTLPHVSNRENSGRPTTPTNYPRNNAESREVSPTDVSSKQVPEPDHVVPSKYYIQPGDTLHGIALRYKLQPQLICRLNNLPLSTLRTTPHLLHTRLYLTLPGSSSSPASSTPTGQEDPALEAERAARRRREVAQNRLRSVTGEEDRGIAEVYVALAEYHDDVQAEGEDGTDGELLPGEKKWVEGNSGSEGKRGDEQKDIVRRRQGAGLEERAVDRYLDDDEWEAREIREGRGVSIPQFPLFERNRSGSATSKTGSEFVGRWAVLPVPPWMKWRG